MTFGKGKKNPGGRGWGSKFTINEEEICKSYDHLQIKKKKWGRLWKFWDFAYLAEDEKLSIDAENILQQLGINNKADHRMLSGDLNNRNICYKVAILNHKTLDSTVPDLFSSNDFKQIISIPSRVTDNTV